MNDMKMRCILVGRRQCSQSFSPEVCGGGSGALQELQILPARFIAAPENLLLEMALV
jgi:hypothetical protein